MKIAYLQVLVSAENRTQARNILDALLKKKIVIGGLTLEAPAQFWWKGKVVKMNYCTIVTFTLAKHKKAIVSVAEKASLEEVPMIAFSPIEGNRKFLNWIRETLE